MSKTAVNGGMFNFQDVMNKFYDYTPDKDDAAGNAMKNSFAANMVQSGFDNVMAKDMSSHQTGLSQDTMTHGADLELRNTTAFMQQENVYNQQSMGAQFDYQNQFADNQVGRDIAVLGAQSEQTQAVNTNQAKANSMERVVQGEQDRLSTQVGGAETRATDSNRIQQEGEQNRASTNTAAKATQAVERTKSYEQRETDTNRIRTEGQEGRETIRTTGDEGRKTSTHEQKIKAKNRNQESALSTQMARNF